MSETDPLLRARQSRTEELQEVGDTSSGVRWYLTRSFVCAMIVNCILVRKLGTRCPCSGQRLQRGVRLVRTACAALYREGDARPVVRCTRCALRVWVASAEPPVPAERRACPAGAPVAPKARVVHHVQSSARRPSRSHGQTNHSSRGVHRDTVAKSSFRSRVPARAELTILASQLLWVRPAFAILEELEHCNAFLRHFVCVTQVARQIEARRGLYNRAVLSTAHRGGRFGRPVLRQAPVHSAATQRARARGGRGQRERSSAAYSAPIDYLVPARADECRATRRVRRRAAGGELHGRVCAAHAVRPRPHARGGTAVQCVLATARAGRATLGPGALAALPTCAQARLEPLHSSLSVRET